MGEDNVYEPMRRDPFTIHFPPIDEEPIDSKQIDKFNKAIKNLNSRGISDYTMRVLQRVKI